MLEHITLNWPPGTQLPYVGPPEITLDSLLLRGLPATGVDLPDNKIFQDLAKKTIILSGVPGTGKTRAIYEVLSSKYGLYLIANTVRGIGSAALLAALHDICVASDAGKDANPYWCLLFLAYLLIFEALKNCNANLLPKQWLLLQLYPARFAEGIDIFHELYAELRHKFQEGLIQPATLTGIVDGFKPALPGLLCVVDEAQDLLREPTAVYTEPGVSLRDPKLPSLLHLFAGFIGPLGITHVVSGTSPELHLAADPAVLGHVAEITEIQSFTTPKSMQDELAKYFPRTTAEFIIDKTAFEALQGRARILMNFVFMLVTKLQKNPGPLGNGNALRAMVNDIIGELIKQWETRLEFILRRDAETCKTMIYQAVSSYAYLGVPLVLYDDTARLMDYGIIKLESHDAPLTFTAKYGGKLEEPVVIQALMNITLRRLNPYKLLLHQDSRSNGYNFESACIAMFLGLMRNRLPGVDDVGTLSGVFRLGTGGIPQITQDFKAWAEKSDTDALAAEVRELKKAHDKLRGDFKDTHDNKDIWPAYRVLRDREKDLTTSKEKGKPEVIAAAQEARDKAADKYDDLFRRLKPAALGDFNKILADWAVIKAKEEDMSQKRYEAYWKAVKREPDVALPEYATYPFRVHVPPRHGQPLVQPFSAEATIQDFFKKPPTAFYLPGTHYGADLAFILEFLPPALGPGPKPPPYFVPAFLQAKFTPASKMVTKLIEDAILKTDPVLLASRGKLDPEVKK